MSTEVGSIFVRIGANLGDLEKGLQNAAGKLKQFGDQMQQIGKSMTLLVTTPLVSAGVAITKFGMDFESSFAKVSTMFDSTKISSEGLQKKILELSTASGKAGTELNEGLYQALSAGIPITGDASDALGFMEKSINLSKAGFTSLTSAVDVTTSIVNAYGLTLEDVDLIQNSLIITQNKGKTTVDELASSLSNVIPIAAALEIPFQQIGASLAAITVQGVPTAQATTMLRAALAELSKSGTMASDSFKEITGKSFKEFIAAGGTVQEAIALMGDRADSLGLEVSDLFASIEAAGGALILASDTGGKAFNDTLQEMSTNTTALDENLKKVGDTVGERWTKAFNELKNAAIEFFDAIAPGIELLSSLISHVAGFLSMFDENGKKVIVVLAGILAAIGPLLIVLGTLISAIASVASFVTGLISTITGSAAAMTVLTTAFSVGQAVIGALATGLGTFLVAVGAATVSFAAFATAILTGTVTIGILIQKIIDWQNRLSELQRLDVEKSTLRHAKALREVREVLGDVTNGTQAFLEIEKQGIETLLKTEEGHKKVSATLKLLAEDQRLLTDRRAEEKKVLDELKDAGARPEEIAAQEKIIEAIDNQISGLIDYKSEINNATKAAVENQNAVSGITEELKDATNQAKEYKAALDGTLPQIIPEADKAYHEKFVADTKARVEEENQIYDKKISEQTKIEEEAIAEKKKRQEDYRRKKEAKDKEAADKEQDLIKQMAANEIANEDLLQKTKEEYEKKEKQRAEELFEEEKKRQSELLEDFKAAEEEKRREIEETQKKREEIDAKIEENQKRQAELEAGISGGMFGGGKDFEFTSTYAGPTLAEKFAADRENKKELLALEAEEKQLQIEKNEALREEIILSDELKTVQTGLIDINNQIAASSPWSGMISELEQYIAKFKEAGDLMGGSGSPPAGGGGGGGAGLNYSSVKDLGTKVSDYFTLSGAGAVSNTSNSTSSTSNSVGDININVGGETTSGNIPSGVSSAVSAIQSFALGIAAKGGRT